MMHCEFGSLRAGGIQFGKPTLLQICGFEDYVRRFTTEFQRYLSTGGEYSSSELTLRSRVAHLFQVAPCGGFHNLPSGNSRSRKRDLINVHVG